mmetsp:Transcript_16160/g.50825  ORF Transcript_16160/g.50825 Transcript_16160/m.50825 type:complete len:218 (+) Transcript_16160:77-730(+)
MASSRLVHSTALPGEVQSWTDHQDEQGRRRPASGEEGARPTPHHMPNTSTATPHRPPTSGSRAPRRTRPREDLITLAEFLAVTRGGRPPQAWAMDRPGTAGNRTSRAPPPTQPRGRRARRTIPMQPPTFLTPVPEETSEDADSLLSLGNHGNRRSQSTGATSSMGGVRGVLRSIRNRLSNVGDLFIMEPTPSPVWIPDDVLLKIIADTEPARSQSGR